jgi:hypothetical protein
MEMMILRYLFGAFAKRMMRAGIVPVENSLLGNSHFHTSGDLGYEQSPVKTQVSFLAETGLSLRHRCDHFFNGGVYFGDTER